MEQKASGFLFIHRPPFQFRFSSRFHFFPVYFWLDENNWIYTESRIKMKTGQRKWR